jgi:hypothetical protein
VSRDTGIADRLRKAGCKVVEIDGWKTRGSDIFTPRGSVDHHTAGAARGNAPSLGVCINGRSGLPGPLCQVLVGRDLTCYVIAAGRANHAGLGGWKGLTGNSSVYGVERENVGTAAEPWRPEQTTHAAKVHAALVKGKAIADMVCRHAEWAPTRKTDTHSVSGTQLRALVAKELNPPSPTPTPPKEDDMPVVILAKDRPARLLDAPLFVTLDPLSHWNCGAAGLKQIEVSPADYDEIRVQSIRALDET